MDKNIETKEELEIIKSVENGEFVSLEKEEFNELKSLLKIASSNTVKKLSQKKSVNVMLLEEDIYKIQAIALNEGISYKNYITHIIHKFANGQFKTVDVVP